MTQMFDLRSFASQYLGCCSAGAAARIGSLPCFGSGLDVWHGNVPRCELHTLHLGAIAGNEHLYMSVGYNDICTKHAKCKSVKTARVDSRTTQKKGLDALRVLACFYTNLYLANGIYMLLAEQRSPVRWRRQ